MTLNLGYRLKRFFEGESGIVEEVNEMPVFPSYIQDRYEKDDLGNFPKHITIRNPLGELIERQNPIELVSFEKSGQAKSIRCYKNYQLGDEFP